MALRPQKLPKIVIFGKNLPLGENKFWGSIGKFEHRCTTTNLPLCNDTIIVLKIILLHDNDDDDDVSVITNFVIPKRDKKTDRQTIFFKVVCCCTRVLVHFFVN